MDVEHHRRAALLAEPGGGELLDRDIDGQHVIVARRAVLARQLADDPPVGVDLDLARTRRAAQIEIVDLLDAALADAELRQRQKRVVREFAFRDLADIADQVRRHRAVGVITAFADIDHGAGQVRDIDFDPRDLRPGQVVAHGDRHETALARGFLEDPRLFDRRQPDQRFQRFEGQLDTGGLLGHQRKTIGLAVDRQYFPEAVDDPTARRRQQLVVDAVVVRLHPVEVGFDDLQLIKAPGEGAEQAELHAAENERPSGEQLVPAGIGFTHLIRSAASPGGPGRTAMSTPGRAGRS